jgi:hypothetical protein
MHDMKILFALAFIAIIAALLCAGFFMVRSPQEGENKGKKMARALALRVFLSVALFGFIGLAYWAGWIQPTGIPR